MSNIQSLRKLSDTNKTDIKRGNAYTIDPRVLVIEPGFNVRGAFTEKYWEQEKVKAHIEGFAKSYTDGLFVPPIVIQVRDGVPLVRDGEHRVRGAMLAIGRGVPLEKVDVVESSGDELAQLTTLSHGNSGLKWSAVEKAVIYGRYRAYGCTVEHIAELHKCSVAHIYQQLTILDMPLELKRMIQAGEVSATEAIRQFAEHGTGALEMFRGVQKQPGQRVTPSQVTKRPPAKVVRQVVSILNTATIPVREVEEGYALVLTAEQYEHFKQLMEFKADE